MKLTPEQIKFIRDEFNVTVNETGDVGEDQWHDIRMGCFDIEAAEATRDEIQPDRVNIAASIVNINYSSLL